MFLRVIGKILIVFLIANQGLHAQNSPVIQDYIDTYKELAIAEMQRTGVPASVTLAQGIHESQAGKSKLVLSSNNHFGIKCKSNWTGETVTHDDDAKGECFRKYFSAEDSYKDHSDFLKNNQRYAFLFQLDPGDYKGWANGLRKAGYATNPKYSEALIKLIEDYQLQDYSLLALQRQPEFQDEQNSGNVSGMQEKKEEQSLMLTTYPEGEFKINETRVVFARKGTIFLSLAQQYNLALVRVFEFNELPEMEMSDKDQLIYLQRKRKTGVSDVHIVQPGETLHGIAQAQGMRLESIRELNWLKRGEEPMPGEKLYLKKKAETIPKHTMKDNYSLTPSLHTKQTTN
ncbi:MAG: glucosaminidase domain-containing protein [Chitinophagales bacterium]|nr:glucosaminidase domain-containing protein [Chitinophagales bacterium]